VRKLSFNKDVLIVVHSKFNYIYKNFDNLDFEVLDTNVVISYTSTFEFLICPMDYDRKGTLEFIVESCVELPKGKKLHNGIGEENLEMKAYTRCITEQDDSLCVIDKLIKKRHNSGKCVIYITSPKVRVNCMVVKIWEKKN